MKCSEQLKLHFETHKAPRDAGSIEPVSCCPGLYTCKRNRLFETGGLNWWIRIK